jgi:predicted nucleic acid-binding protein
MTVHKLKLYLDTSVISYLDQTDSPEKTAETRLFWEKLKAGKFDVVISDVDIAELEKNKDEKQKILFGYLQQIPYTLIETEDKAVKIAERFVDLAVLKRKSFDDCRHIANAIVSGCDIIVSWNFKHIVNHKTQVGVKTVTALEGYKDLLIYTPTFFIGGDDDTL